MEKSYNGPSASNKAKIAAAIAGFAIFLTPTYKSYLMNAFGPVCSRRHNVRIGGGDSPAIRENALRRARKLLLVSWRFGTFQKQALARPGSKSREVRLRGQVDLRNAQSVLPHYKFLLVIFSAELRWNGARRSAGVLSWRAAHDAAKSLTEGALRLVAERLRDGGEAVRGVL
jgi:hypothetical protein